MHQQCVGDSYDIVKRFWVETLHSIAPLFAHPIFVPPKIAGPYTFLTTIPILDTRPNTPFGIFLDPHTGILLLDESTETG